MASFIVTVIKSTVVTLPAQTCVLTVVLLAKGAPDDATAETALVQEYLERLEPAAVSEALAGPYWNDAERVVSTEQLALEFEGLEQVALYVANLRALNVKVVCAVKVAMLWADVDMTMLTVLAAGLCCYHRRCWSETMQVCTAAEGGQQPLCEYHRSGCLAMALECVQGFDCATGRHSGAFVGSSECAARPMTPDFADERHALTGSKPLLRGASSTSDTGSNGLAV
jgi:hypothetical protein